MCVCVCVCVHVYICTSVCVHVYICTCVRVIPLTSSLSKDHTLSTGAGRLVSSSSSIPCIELGSEAKASFGLTP